MAVDLFIQISGRSGSPVIDLICPDCHSSLLVKNDVYVCSQCSWVGENYGGIHAILGTRDQSDVIFKQYISNYDQISFDDSVERIQTEKFSLYQTAKLFSYIPSLEKTIVADVGIGRGHMTKKLIASKCKQVVAVDISRAYLAPYLNMEKITPVMANAENLPFKSYFDVLIATDILEHVLNVGDFLISMNRALKLGGLCLIRVPFEENLLQYAMQKGCPYKFVHLRTFNKGLLKTMLADVGFEPVAWHCDGFSINRTRSFIYDNPYLWKRFYKFMNKKFPDKEDIASLPNWLGSLFFKPYEIVVVAQKKSNLN